MINPYQPPAFDARQFQDAPSYTPGSEAYGWVKQVRTFAVLNAVQGALEIPVGLMMSGMSVFLPTLARLDRNANGNNGDQGQIDTWMLWLMAGIYLAIGLPVLASGILRIVAGVKNYRFGGRTLAMVSLILGMASMLTCYCAPTAMGLFVYGLILHMNPAVKAAFEMARQGRTAPEILAAFSPEQAAYYTAAPSPPQTGAGESPFG
jgi:hypothetical protein